MKNLNLKPILSLLLIGVFFLPTFDESPENTGAWIRLINTRNTVEYFKVFGFFLYLLPILSLINLFFDVLKVKRIVLFNEFIFGFIITIFLPLVWILKGLKFWSFFFFPSFGYYLIFIISITGIIITYKTIIKSYVTSKNSIMDKKNIIIGLLLVITVTLVYIATQKKTHRVFQKEIRIIRPSTGGSSWSNFRNC